jgi:hypothetical protein
LSLPNRQKKHTDIGTAEKNYIKPTQQSGITKSAEKTASAQLYIHQNKWQKSTMPEEFQYDIYLMLCVQT